MRKFRLLVGQHIEPDPKAKSYKEDPENYNPIGIRYFADGIHIVNDVETEMIGKNVIESNIDLCQRFNIPGFPPKFEELYESYPSAGIPQAPSTDDFLIAELKSRGYEVSRDTLDTMNLKELTALAAEEEIDLKGATKKEDIIRIIRSSHVNV
jgi:hypothetical protein